VVTVLPLSLDQLYLELSRQPGLWPAASRRGQCRRRDAGGL